MMASQSSLKLVPRCRRLCSPSVLLGTPQSRRFSSFDEKPLDQSQPAVFDTGHTLWPDPRLGLLSPQDPRFPLPGAVGQPGALQSSAHTVPQIVELPPSRQDVIMNKLGTYVMPAADEEAGDSTESVPATKFELMAHDCPATVRRDLAELFPGVAFEGGAFTVVIVSRRTENDMSVWTREADEERERLLDQFISEAEQRCLALQTHGFWADFIDPSCGRPYLGAHTNATLFETDERYRHFGLRIEDLGCCKVISHPKWGTHAYVGSLFTNAPTDHPVLACA